MTEEIFPLLPKGIRDLEWHKFTLDDEGKVAVRIVTVAGDSGLSSLGSVSTPSGNVTSEQSVATIPLSASTQYQDIEVHISCSRECVGRVVLVSDVGVTDVITELIPGIFLGGGNNTFAFNYKNIGNFTSGAVGVQELQFLARVLNPPSGASVYASLGVNEVQ